MKSIILATAVAALVAVSCSDDTTTTPTTNDPYLATGGGSEFIYDSQVTTKSQSGADSMASQSSDTMRVSPTKRTMGGKECYEYITVSSNGSTPDTSYMYQDGSKIYMYFDLAKQVKIESIALPSFGSQWILVADANQTTWTALTLPITDVPFMYQGFSLKLNGTITVTGTKLGTENVMVDGKTVSCIKYKRNVAGTVSSVVPGLGTLAFPLSVVSEAKYGKSVGLVEEKTPPSTFGSGEMSAEIKGSYKLLTKYTIK